MRINAISPGAIDTDIQPPGRLERLTPLLPMGRAGKADEVAEAILFLLSDAASYVNGSELARFGRALRRILCRHAPCARRLAAYDPRRIRPQTILVYSRGETWLRQCAFTNTAVPKL